MGAVAAVLVATLAEASFVMLHSRARGIGRWILRTKALGDIGRYDPLQRLHAAQIKDERAELVASTQLYPK